MDDATFAEKRRDFFQAPSIAVGFLLAAEVLPFEGLGSPVRLVLTVAWFASVVVLLCALLKPLQVYLEALYSWRYQDSGPALQKTWQLYLHSLWRARVPAIAAGLSFFSGLGLETLASWPVLSGLRALAPIYGLAYILGGLGLLAYPFLGGYLFAEAAQRARLLKEHSSTDEFKPRSVQEVSRGRIARKPAKPFEVLGNLRFRAAGTNWDWEDFYKNVIVFGAIGTGKTVCVLNTLLHGLVGSATAPGLAASGLVLDPKGDFDGKLRRLFSEYDREKDLLVLDPTSDATIIWNPLDSEDDELELAARFAAVLESTGMKSGAESFWIDSCRKFLRHAIALLRLTNEADEPPCFEQIYELATSMDEIKERCSELEFGEKRASQALQFFTNEWGKLADETRTSIQSHLTNMLDPFLMEPYCRVFAGKSTMGIGEMVDQGKVLYVHMPIADKEAMARVVGTFAKLEFNREILKRPDKERRSFFLCDEFQAFLTQAAQRGDADFFERSRQSNHVNLVATQNVPALKKVLDKEAAVNNLLGNCGVKIFLRNHDAETNKYASELFGEKLVAMMNQNLGGSGGTRSAGAHGASFTYDKKVRKEVFQSLIIPSRSEGTAWAETICHVASRSTIDQKRLRWDVHPLAV